MRAPVVVFEAYRSLVVATLLGVVWPSAARAEPAGAPSGATFSELTTQAKEQRESDAHADSARSFAAAYAVLDPEQQAGVRGEIAVNNAVDDFRTAQQRAPDDRALLVDEIALLETFEANTEREGDMPPGLAEELVRARSRLGELDASQEVESNSPPGAGPERDTPQPAGPQPEPEPVASPKRNRDTAGLVLLGSGVAAAAGGVSLIGGGAWMFGAASERRDDRLAALDADEYPDEDALRDDLDQWYQRGRGIATGLVVSGAVLTGVGTGLITWGAVRLRREGRSPGPRASVVVPMLGRHRVGAAVTVVF